MSPLILDYPIMITMCIFVYRVLEEKEYNIKEYMKIMGLSESSYNLSWIIFY